MTFQMLSGREYLKIDIANNFGNNNDKKTWDQRLSWFDQNEAKLDSLVPQAEQPALFYAGVKAWKDVQANKPIGYMISLDATSSGLQLLAALTGCKRTASLCNVVDTGKREDAYTGIYSTMLKKVQDTSKISRDQTKDAIMTAFYNSRAVPKKVFGEGALLDTFYSTLSEEAPGAWELTEAMESFWDPEATEHSWTLPDNFHVHIKVMAQVRDTVHFCNQPFDVYYNINAPIKEGRSLGANTIHSIDGMIVRELTRRCDYDSKRVQGLYELLKQDSFPNPKVTESSCDSIMVRTLWRHFQQTGYLSARIIDHLTNETMALVDLGEIKQLLDSLPFRPFKVVSIHDCFRCLPHYGNDLRQQYNLQLQLIAKSNLLENIIGQIIGKPVIINKLDPLMHQQIGHTNYALS